MTGEQHRWGLVARTRRAGARSLVVLAVSAVLAGSLVACGDEQPPGDAVPALQTRLDQVDAAVAAGDDDRTRRVLDALEADTDRARTDGAITPEQADEILGAVDRVRAELPPVETPAATPSTSATSTPSTTTPPAPTRSPAPTGPAGPAGPGKGDDKDDDKDDKGKGKKDDEKDDDDDEDDD